MILEFDSFEEAQACLDYIEEKFMEFWSEKNMKPGIVGRNAITGYPDDRAECTILWDVVRESPQGSFYVASPVIDARFKNIAYDLSAFSFQEKEFPESWKHVEEDHSGFIQTIRTFSKRLLDVFRA